MRRSGHGSTAWSSDVNLRQPQDGAFERPASELKKSLIDIATRRAAFAEPEDARLTGGTRSLMRRMFGLNIAARAVAKVAPALQGQPAKSPLTA